MINDSLSSTLPNFKSAVDTLIKWIKEVKNSLKAKYTNSSTKGKNNKIKVIKRDTYGFKISKKLRILVKLRDFKYMEV